MLHGQGSGINIWIINTWLNYNSWDELKPFFAYDPPTLAIATPNGPTEGGASITLQGTFIAFAVASTLFHIAPCRYKHGSFA